MFASAKGGGAEIDPTKRRKNLKIRGIADRHGLPLSVRTHAANRHEVALVQLSFEFHMVDTMPENLIGDRAYDSDKLGEELRNVGIEMTSPHQQNRVKPKTSQRIVSVCDAIGDSPICRRPWRMVPTS